MENAYCTWYKNGNKNSGGCLHKALFLSSYQSDPKPIALFQTHNDVMFDFNFFGIFV